MNDTRLPRLGRLSGAARFAQVLALRPCAKSAHFAAYHQRPAELSTGRNIAGVATVDGRPGDGLEGPPDNACSTADRVEVVMSPAHAHAHAHADADAGRTNTPGTLGTPGFPAAPTPPPRNPGAPGRVTPTHAVPSPWLLGLVVPKRFARRSVTRSLVKRQMRIALREHALHLPAGAWVLRLRAPVQATGETSAVTAGLRQRVQQELSELLSAARQQAGQPLAGGSRGRRREATPRPAAAVQVTEPAAASAAGVSSSAQEPLQP